MKNSNTVKAATLVATIGATCNLGICWDAEGTAPLTEGTYRGNTTITSSKAGGRSEVWRADNGLEDFCWSWNAYNGDPSYNDGSDGVQVATHDTGSWAEVYDMESVAGFYLGNTEVHPLVVSMAHLGTVHWC